jgi:hypothetical protein
LGLITMPGAHAPRLRLMPGRQIPAIHEAVAVNVAPAPAPKGRISAPPWPSGRSGSARHPCAASGCRRAAPSPRLRRPGPVGIHDCPLLAIGGPAQGAFLVGARQVGARHGDELMRSTPCTPLAITSAISWRHTASS